MSEKKKRKTRPIVAAISTIFFLAVSIFLLYNVFSEARITYTLLVDIKDAKAEYDALLAENEQLTNRKEKLQDPNYVENYARGEYMITKEGEAIYHLPAQSEE